MRARSNLRTAAALLVFTLSLTLLPASPARADWPIAYPTGICDPEHGYAEFIVASLPRDAELEQSVCYKTKSSSQCGNYCDLQCNLQAPPRIDEFDEYTEFLKLDDSTAITVRPWRCDLSDEHSVTVFYEEIQSLSYNSYKCFYPHLIAIWLNGVLVHKKYYDDCAGGKEFHNFSLTLDEGKIYHQSGFNEIVDKVSWPDPKTPKDPEFIPGWAEGEPLPAEVQVPSLLIEGQGNPVCEEVQAAFKGEPSSVEFLYQPLDKSFAEADIYKDEGNTHGNELYPVDLNNDGKKDYIRFLVVSEKYDTTWGYITYDSAPDNLKHYLDISPEGYEKKYWRYEYSARVTTSTVTFTSYFTPNSIPQVITVNGKYYIFVGKSNDHIFSYKNPTRTIYEHQTDFSRKPICTFSAPYVHFEGYPRTMQND